MEDGINKDVRGRAREIRRQLLNCLRLKIPCRSRGESHMVRERPPAWGKLSVKSLKIGDGR